jgi:hypothetical protein
MLTLISCIRACRSHHIRNLFTFAHKHKHNLKDRPSDWLALPSSNEIVSVTQALDGDAVFIMADRWREAVEEAEMGDTAGVKVSKQRQNTTCFDPDWP